MMDNETDSAPELSSWFQERGVLAAVRQLLSERACEGYLVGGYVRDLLLGRYTRDLDLVVAGDALRLAREVADRLGGAFVLLDKERSTARVVLREGGDRFYVDLATMHSDGLAVDLERRDFTVNAMAIDIRDASTCPEVIDPLGGQSDLRGRLLRAVAEEVFRNDPIRLLRAVRLAAELGLEMEGRTEGLMARDASLLGQASAERVRDEFWQILAFSDTEASLRRLEGLRLLSVLLPELDPLRGLEQPPPHTEDAFEHSLAVVRALDQVQGAVRRMAQDGGTLAMLPGIEGDGAQGHLEEAVAPYAQQLVVLLDQHLVDERGRSALLKLAGLLHDVGKPQARSVDQDGRGRFLGHAEEGAAIAGAVARRLRLGNREVRLVQTLVRQHMRPLHLARLSSLSRRAVYRFFRDTQGGGVDVLLLALGDNLALVHGGSNLEQWQRICQTVGLLLAAYYERYEEMVEPQLLVSGRDLLETVGMEPGPAVGQILRAVGEAQATGEVSTREEALKLARSLLGGR